MLNAPLCKRCARMLHGSALTVFRISGAHEDERPCPWCQREKPDGIYRIQATENK